jgi:predicted GIY-YIG superfamily endonuclease
MATKKAAPARKSAKKYEAKTRPADASVDAHIGAIADPGRRQDCRTLVEVFGKATGMAPKMWGPSIVAFGKYHYKYDSGHEGDSCLAGFASRKGAITLYLMGVIDDQKELMARLGKHKTGKGCIYLKDLDAVELDALGELVERSVAYVRAKYPDSD